MRLAIFSLVCLAACGAEQGLTGPTGPQGPAGPPGAGARYVFASAEYKKEQSVKAGAFGLQEPYTYRVAEFAQVPESAIALHIQATGCMPPGNSGPAALKFKPSGMATDVSLYISAACRTLGNEAMQIWMPAKDASVVVTAHNSSGASPYVLSGLTVLGWLE